MKKLSSKYRWLLAFAFVVVAIAIFFCYNQYNKGLADTLYLKSDFRLNASALIQAFMADEQTADIRYSNKILSVRGVVKSIHATDSTASVFLSDGSNATSVICQFENDSKKQVRNLQAGEEVTVKGVCSGYLMDVVIVRCVLE